MASCGTKANDVNYIHNYSDDADLLRLDILPERERLEANGYGGQIKEIQSTPKSTLSIRNKTLQNIITDMFFDYTKKNEILK